MKDLIKKTLAPFKIRLDDPPAFEPVRRPPSKPRRSEMRRFMIDIPTTA